MGCQPAPGETPASNDGRLCCHCFARGSGCLHVNEYVPCLCGYHLCPAVPGMYQRYRTFTKCCGRNHRTHTQHGRRVELRGAGMFIWFSPGLRQPRGSKKKKNKDVQKHGTSLQKVTAAKMYLLQILPPSPVSPTPRRRPPNSTQLGKGSGGESVTGKKKKELNLTGTCSNL